jgi:hypothetical protein
LCEVDKPRSLIVDDITNKIFALERGTQSIINLFDSDNDGIPDSKQTVAFASGLNHGLAIHDGFIYASSDSTVYRWPNDNIDSSTHPLDEDAAVIVINNINEDGSGGAPRGHTTRTLEFDDKGWLYVSVGSGGNVDYNSYRSRIRRMDLSGDPTTLSFPQDFQTMEVFADGLRNEVGLAFDKHGALWGVENSADNLQRDDLGGDIHENNVSNYSQYIILNLLKPILFFKIKLLGIEERQKILYSNFKLFMISAGRRIKQIQSRRCREALRIPLLLDRIRASNNWNGKRYGMGVAKFL